MNTEHRLNTAVNKVFMGCNDILKDKARELTYEHLKNTIIGMKARKNLPWKLDEDQSYEQVLNDFFLHSDMNDRKKLIQYLGWMKIGLGFDEELH